MEDLKHAQIALEGNIDDLNQEFESEYQHTNNESQYKRQEVLQTLENVYTKYLELISNLNEGSKFYSDFIIKSNSVLKECDEYVYHRRVEGRELEMFLNNQAVPVESVGSQQLAPDFPPQPMGGTWNPNNGIKFG